MKTEFQKRIENQQKKLEKWYANEKKSDDCVLCRRKQNKLPKQDHKNTLCSECMLKVAEYFDYVSDTVNIDYQSFNLEAIRQEVAAFQRTLNWYTERGGLLPYDWNSYGHRHIMRLLELCKVGFDSRIKKKDKRGVWR